MPCIVLDVPHQWSGWTKRALIGADDILIVAAPDLANLRNTKNLFDLLKAVAAQRPAAALLPQPGRRAEAAGNQRRRIRQGDREPADRRHPVRSADVRLGRQQRPDDRGDRRQAIAATEMFLQIAQRLTGRGETEEAEGRSLSPLIDKLRAK